jgi:hypothetical protein
MWKVINSFEDRTCDDAAGGSYLFKYLELVLLLKSEEPGLEKHTTFVNILQYRLSLGFGRWTLIPVSSLSVRNIRSDGVFLVSFRLSLYLDFNYLSQSR